MKKKTFDNSQFLPTPRFPLEGGGFGLFVKDDLSFCGEVELVGKSFGGVFSYKVEEGKISFEKKVIAYHLNQSEFSFSDSSFVRILVNGTALDEKVDRIEEEGRLLVFSHGDKGILTARSFFPCAYAPGVIEKIEVQTPFSANLSLSFDDWNQTSKNILYGGALCDEKGTYMKGFQNQSLRKLPEGGYTCFYILWYITLPDVDFVVEGKIEDARRMALVEGGKSVLRLTTPLPHYNSAFSQSIFNMRQCITGQGTGDAFAIPSGGEYSQISMEEFSLSAPLYACMGDERGVAQLINGLNKISKAIKECKDKKQKNKFPTLILAKGDAVLGADLGESAYYASGTARSLLSMGSAPFCRAYYPDLLYALSCCKEKIGKDGLLKIKGKIDGKICFSAYQGFYYGAMLADQIGERTDSIKFAYFAEELKEAMVKNKVYLPLSIEMGEVDFDIAELEKGDFSPYEILSIIKALYLAKKDNADLVLQKFVEKCMIINRVIGAGEDGKSNSCLSACIAETFLCGMLGFKPLSFTSFSLRPHLCGVVDRVRVEGLWIYGHTFDIEIEDNIVALFDEYDKLVFKREFERGETVVVSLEKK